MRINCHTDATTLWLDHHEQLRAYLTRRLGDAELAAELTQRTLLKVIDSCCSGTELRNVKSWLYQIARNVVADHYRELTKAGAGPQDVSIPGEDRAVASRDGDDLWRQMARHLYPLLRLLPEAYATPLRLADLEGLPQQEVAERLGLGLSATKSRIQRARVMLREQIAACSHLELDERGRPVDFAIRDDCACLQEPFPKKC